MKLASGAETAGLKQIDSRPLICPAWIASMISCAGMPLPGISDSSQPHTDATCARCSGLVMSRLPGSWSHLWPCSLPPWPLPCPVIVDTPQPGLPNLPVARPRLMAASTLSTPLVCCSMPAGVEQHPGRRRAPPLGGLLDARRRDARDPRRPTRGHVDDGCGGLVEARRVGVDERRGRAGRGGSARAARHRTTPSPCPDGRRGRGRRCGPAARPAGPARSAWRHDRGPATRSWW